MLENKLKQNFRVSEHSFRIRKEKKEDNIIKDIQNLSRLRKEIGNSATKVIKFFSG